MDATPKLLDDYLVSEFKEDFMSYMHTFKPLLIRDS